MAEPINYDQYRLGTKDGEIRFGTIHEDGIIAGVEITSGESAENGIPHYIVMDKTGDSKIGRKGSTTIECPGTFNVKAGYTCDSSQSIPGVFIDAVSGDLILSAQSGRIRIIAENIELITTGSGGENGNISLDANEKIIIDGKQGITITSETSTRIFSENTVDVIGKAILNIYGGLIDAADGATKVNGSKPCSGPHTNEEQNKR